MQGISNRCVNFNIFAGRENGAFQSGKKCLLVYRLQCRGQSAKGWPVRFIALATNYKATTLWQHLFSLPYYNCGQLGRLLPI